MIDADAKLERYKVVILPDNIRLDEALRERFQMYLDQGGKLLLSGTSGLMAGKPDRFG